MDIHKNARLTLRRREDLVQYVAHSQNRRNKREECFFLASPFIGPSAGCR
jgi:hypothetical protein